MTKTRLIHQPMFFLLLLWLLLLSFPERSSSFLHTGICQSSSSSSSSSSHTPLSATSEYSDSQVQEMEELIVSLSMETSDERRRQKMVSIFEEALMDSPEQFTDLFDKCLITIGDRVKKEAYEQATTTKQQDHNNDDPPEKTVEEQQLWALVDMMVQSKTIVKQATSKGTFQ